MTPADRLKTRSYVPGIRDEAGLVGSLSNSPFMLAFPVDAIIIFRLQHVRRSFIMPLLDFATVVMSVVSQEEEDVVLVCCLVCLHSTRVSQLG